MRDKRCWRCKHWDSFADVRRARGEGLCRVHSPPLLYGVGAFRPRPAGAFRRGMDGYWPRTGGEDWCGEFEETLKETRKAINVREVAR